MNNSPYIPAGLASEGHRVCDSCLKETEQFRDFRDGQTFCVDCIIGALEAERDDLASAARAFLAAVERAKGDLTDVQRITFFEGPAELALAVLAHSRETP